MIKRNISLFLLVLSSFMANAQHVGVVDQPSIKDIVDYLNQQASYFFKKGDYLKAISDAEAAIEIYSTYCDTTDLTYASYLSNLAYYNYNFGNYEKAIEQETMSFQIRENNKEEHPVDYSISLFHFCDYYGDLGDFEKSLSFGRRALSLLKGQPAQDSLYLIALASLVCNSIYAGEYEFSENLLEEGFEKCRDLGLEVSHVSALLHTHKGMLLGEQGNCGLALEYNLKGKDLFEQTVGKQHPHYAYALNNAGTCAVMMGDYVSSVNYFKECLEIRKRVFGINHQYYIRSLGNLGVTYEYMEDMASAKRLCNQAVVLDELQFGVNSYEYFLDLTDVARQCFYMGEFKEAIELQSQVLSIGKNIVGENHYRYALAVLALADYYAGDGDYLKAISLANKGLSIIKSSLGDDNHLNSKFYLSLANYDLSMNDYHSALDFINLSINEIVKYNGKGSYQYSDALLKRIKISEKLGNIDINDVIEYDNYLHGIIVHNFTNMTKAERDRFWSNNNRWFLEIMPKYAVSLKDTILVSKLYNDVLLAKGLTLFTGIEIKKSMLSNDSPEAQRDFIKLSQINEQIESLIKLPINERYLSVDSLLIEREKLEQTLIQSSKQYSSYMDKLQTDWQTIKSALQEDEIAIEFVEVPVSTHNMAYCALVLKPDLEYPVLETLFEDSELFRVSPRDYYANPNLYNLVWSKLSNYLQSAKTVYFSPCGYLHKIAIEYSMSPEGERFSESFNTYRLSSTRVILNQNHRSKSGDVALFGGIQYDVIGDSNPANSLIDTGTIRRGFSYLPATKKECEEIQSIFSSKHSVRFYSGEEATETIFKSFSGKAPCYIHIATHGFYWSADDIRKEHLDYDFLLSENDSQVSYEQRVLSHSGLLFSRANQTLKEGKTAPLSDDGILTSNEISNIDLDGTELLVLSACQTGLGDISADEVYGLQRGFKAAGVRTIIMSLWEVDDYATGLLMKKFYEYLNKNLSPSESLRKAQHYVENYDGTIRINGEKVHVNYSDPKYWAAFIVLDGI